MQEHVSRLSPAGDRLVYWMEQARCDIAIADLSRGGVTRLTSEGDNHYPTWLPDGQHVAYLSGPPRPGATQYSLFI